MLSFKEEVLKMKLQSVEEFFHKRETVEKYNVDKIIKLNWECPDVLFSFRGVYAIGVFIYYRQLFGDNVKTDIKVKDEKGATRQRLYSDKFLSENYPQFSDVNDLPEIKGFLEHYYDIGNIIPTWPGANINRGMAHCYAVQLLERIKHYLYDDRITFVFSVNLGELQHTIKHYYGNTFDACRYLDRFFDMRISLPPADKTAFYREMGLESSYVLEKICRKVIDTYNMELREATRFYRQVKTAAYEPTHESRKFDFSFSDEKGRQLLLMYVVPILVGLKIVDISLYNQFVCGKSSKPLMDIYKDSDKGEWLATRLLNRNEAFEVEEGKSVVTVEQKIQQLYDAIFVTEYTGNVYHTILGEYEFDDNSKNFVKSVESMLSVYADYNI